MRGTPIPGAGPETARPVHPRACGEHLCLCLCICIFIGSSPRMRGTPARSILVITRMRFIPAHAGNTSRGTFTPRPAPVHPRACGEHQAGKGATGDVIGSSPRMRGTRGCRRPPISRIRFIPAHAGNTRSASGLVPSWPVHPRACGEHVMRVRFPPGWSGSSPRMRGTP